MKLLSRHKSKPLFECDYDLVIHSLKNEDYKSVVSIYDYFKRFDAAISSEVMNRRFKMCSYPIYINSKNKEQKEFLQNYINTSEFKLLAFDMSSAVVYGFCAFAKKYKVIKDKVYPDYKFISHRYFDMDKDERLFIRADSDVLYLDESDSLFAHYHPTDSGNLIESALMSNIIITASIKHLIKAKSISYLDNLSVPPVVVKTDKISGSDELNDLVEQLLNLRSASVGVFGKEDMVELLNAGISTSNFTDFLRYCDEELSKIISSQVLASNSTQNGTQALGNVHEKRANTISDMDATLLSSSINKILKETLELNYDYVDEFEFVYDTNEEADESYLAGIYSQITQMGYEIPVEFIAKTFKIDGLKKADTPRFNDFNKLELNSVNKLSKTSMEQLVDNEYKDYSELIYNKLLEIYDRCNSYEELQDELINSYPELDFSDIAKGLKEALMKAKIGSLITLEDDE